MNNPAFLEILDLGVMAYKPAWDKQLEIHAQVSDGKFAAGTLLFVEHPPVVTIGRHPGSAKHLLAGEALLRARGVEVIETDRGGDITFHGPGQLVAYPILDLNHYHLNLHAYMRLLEEIVITTLGHYGVRGERSEGATGVWVRPSSSSGRQPLTTDLAKICAMGVKLRRWVTFHGLALNVTTDLSYFGLINPCGLSRPVTSLQKLLGDQTPSMQQVKDTMAAAFKSLLDAQKRQSPASS